MTQNQHLQTNQQHFTCTITISNDFPISAGLQGKGGSRATDIDNWDKRDVQQRPAIEFRDFDLNDLVKVSTAAGMKNVGRQSVYYHIETGRLRHIAIDGVTFVFKSEVEALKTREQAPKDRDAVEDEKFPTDSADGF